MDAPGATLLDKSAVQSTPTDMTSVQGGSSTETTQATKDRRLLQDDPSSSGSDNEEDDQEHSEDEEESDEDDEEPRLKYAYLTKHLGSVYRNGDATSSFLVAGDKMVCSFEDRFDIKA